MFWTRLKQYLPRGLYGRAALILLLPVVSLQLLVSVVFIQRHYAGVTDQMTRSILLEVDYILPLYDQATDPTVVVRDVAAPLGIDLATSEATVPESDRRAFYDLSGRVMIGVLREAHPEILAFDLSDRRVARFWIPSRHGVLEVAFGRHRVSASNPHQLIVIMVVLGAVIALISYIFLRNQLRPIKRMARAATEYGRGRIVPFSPTGATEVRAAGTAFLDMRTRIERQNQSRTMMLSGVSHDLRTPLTRLRLGLSMMDEDEAGPLIRDVDEMQHLIDTFLDYARGDAMDDMVVTDPLQLLQEVVADAGRARLNVQVTDVPEAPVSAVPLRPMAVRRALDNLIGNALRYGTRAEVSLQMLDRSIRYSVEDDGPGIAPEDRDEAMRPFTRLDPARNQDRGSGVGLGLAIVSDIARAHGGSLRLGDSERLGGLRVDLVLAR